MLVCALSAISHYVCVTSLTSGSCDPLDILDAIRRVKVDGTRASVSTHQPSEQGYLNLTSPLVPPDTKGTGESSNNGDQVWEVVDFGGVVACVYNSELPAKISAISQRIGQ